MGYVEIVKNDMTVIRIQDGVAERGKMQICDAEGKYRSPFGGGSPTEELWFCANCYTSWLKLRRETDCQ